MKLACLLVLVVATIMENSAMNQTAPINCPAWNLPGIRINVAHPDKCEYYYKCLYGLPHLRVCPWAGGQRLHFNPKQQICDSPSNAGCDSSADSTGTSTTTVKPPTCPPQGTHKLPNPPLCNSYIICINGNHREACCPNGPFDVSASACSNIGANTCVPWGFCDEIAI